MTKLWVKNGKLIMRGGKLALCGACPCEGGSGSGSGGSGVNVLECQTYDAQTGQLDNQGLATLTMKYWENSVFQCQETWTWNNNVGDPGWEPPEPTSVLGESLCNGATLFHCNDQGEGDCTIWKLRFVSGTVPDDFVTANVSCSSPPFRVLFNWTFGFPTPINYAVEFKAN